MNFQSLEEGRRKRERREMSIRGQFSLDQAVAEALDDLRYRRCSIFEMPPVSIEDESSFEEANPEHPEAASNRFERIDAAEYLYRLVRLLNGHTLGEVDEVTDFFRGVARAKAVAIEQRVSNDLHEALFDRDAAVRLTIVEILAVLARPESIPFLERLSDSEDEGVLIPQAIPKALDCCRNAKARDIRNWLSDVPGTLNCDVVDCWLALNGRDSQVHRRNLVRAVFAAIEGCLSVLKMQVLEECHGGGFRLSRAEAALLEEEAYDVTDSGQSRVRPFFVPTERNIRFAFTMFARARGVSLHLDYSGRGWQALGKAVHVRNRITHPKASADLSVSDGEIKLVEEAYSWFVDASFAVWPEGKADILGLLEEAGWPLVVGVAA